MESTSWKIQINCSLTICYDWPDYDHGDPGARADLGGSFRAAGTSTRTVPDRWKDEVSSAFVCRGEENGVANALKSLSPLKLVSFIHSFIHSLILSFIHSFILSFIHSFIHSFILETYIAPLQDTTT